MRLLSHIRPVMTMVLRPSSAFNHGSSGGGGGGMIVHLPFAKVPNHGYVHRHIHRHHPRRCYAKCTSDDSNSNEEDSASTDLVPRSIISSSSSYTMHSSFAEELIDRYDAFILDQFGVLHNGVAALDGAIELCEYLHKQAGKRLFVLSNTSAPADKTLLKLSTKLGFDARLFCGAVTSGEEASRYIRATFGGGNSGNSSNDDNNNNTPTSMALMLTWDVSISNNPRLTATPEAFLKQCGNVNVAVSVEEADFLLFHGSEVWYRGSGNNNEQIQQQQQQESLGNFIETGDFTVVDPLLQQCVSRGLKAVCANPDLIVQTPTGGTAYMPGQLARRYQEMGGDCIVFGKPAVEHFESCIQKLNESHSSNSNGDAATAVIPKSRVAHVGDSLHHDVLGASRADIASIFVTSGIHRHDLETGFGVLPETDVLDRLFQKEGGIVPTHVISAFRL
jgi:ribonucleotide monophosphatase NagD (HAD superfamily)